MNKDNVTTDLNIMFIDDYLLDRVPLYDYIHNIICSSTFQGYILIHIQLGHRNQNHICNRLSFNYTKL